MPRPYSETRCFRHPLLARLMVLLALVGASAPARAQDAAAFEEGAAAAEALVRRGDWDASREAWLELLRAHAGADYARPRIPEIRESLRRAAFWTTHKRPRAKELVSGRLSAYDRSSGKVRISYEPDGLQDFEKVANFWLHPLRFRKTYTVEVTGPPKLLEGQTIFVAMGLDNGYAIQLGDNEEGRYIYTKHVLSRIKGRRTKTVDTKDPKERKKDAKPRDSTVEVTVSKKSIRVKYDGRSILSASNEDGELGRFGFADAKKLTGIEVRGSAEIAWIEDLVDASVEAERKAFDRRYEDPPELAAWAVAEPRKRRTTDVREIASKLPLPDKFTPDQLKNVETVMALIKSGKTGRALATLDVFDADALPEASQVFLQMMAHIGASAHAAALERAEALAGLSDPSPELRRITALLRIREERYADAIRDLESMLDQDPGDVDLEVELATVLMLEGRFDDARARIDGALVRSPGDPDLVSLRAQVAKAGQGPAWKKTFDEVGERTEVRSDISARMTRILARHSEETLAYLHETFGPMPHPEQRIKVYVFSGESGYTAYIDGVADDSPENTAGLYSARLKQILVANQPDRAQLTSVLRHELVHAYMDRLMGGSPTWFGEGTAEYFAAARREDRSWKEGAPVASHLLVFRRLGRKKLTVEQLVTMDHESFMLNSTYTYPMSWAFVDFLRNSTPRNAAIFDALWSSLKEQGDPETASRAVFEGVDMKKLDRAFWASVKEKL